MENSNSELIKAQNLFINDLKAKKRASATILAYKKDITQLIDYLNSLSKTSFSLVKTIDLQDFLKKISKDFTPKTISRKINAIKTFYRFLINNKIANENISTPISHPKFENKKPRILSKIEYRALRDTCREDARTSAIIEILLQAGLRISELANLKLEDIKEKTLYVKGYETHEGREIPLNKAAKIAVDRYSKERPKTNETTVFITKNQKPLLIRNIRSTLERYFKKAGINNVCVNDLRHTFIYYQLSSGASVSLVSKIVGHKRINSTQKYLELIKETVKKKNKLEEL